MIWILQSLKDLFDICSLVDKVYKLVHSCVRYECFNAWNVPLCMCVCISSLYDSGDSPCYFVSILECFLMVSIVIVWSLALCSVVMVIQVIEAIYLCTFCVPPTVCLFRSLQCLWFPLSNASQIAMQLTIIPNVPVQTNSSLI